MENRIGFSVDAICDLPDEYLEQYDISSVYYYVNTDTGHFRDCLEISSDNLLEYMEEGKTAITESPSVDDYRKVFQEKLEKYQDVIHVTISKNIDPEVYANVTQARAQMGDLAQRIHILDSGHVSSGTGLLLMELNKLYQEGKSVDQILSEAEKIKGQIITSFVTGNIDFLYINGRIAKWVRDLCVLLHLRPVLYIRNGKLCLKSVLPGSYEYAARQYIRQTLRSKHIDKSLAFITGVGCSADSIHKMKEEIQEKYHFQEILLMKASATISGNCGRGTFGILYVKK